MKVLGIALVLFVIVASVAGGIGFLASASSTQTVTLDKSILWVGQASSETLTITPSGPDELLLVATAYNTNYGTYPPTSPGLNLQQVMHEDTSSSIGVNVYYAVLGSAQTYSVTISYQGVTNNLGVILATFSGENLTSPIAQSVGAKGHNSAPSVAITPLSSSDLIWGFTGSNTPVTQTAGQGFTRDQATIYYGSPADEYGFSSSAVSFGTLVSGTWAMIGVEIQSSGASITSTTTSTTVSTTTISVTNQFYVTTTTTLPLPPNTVVSTVNVTSTITHTEYK